MNFKRRREVHKPKTMSLSEYFDDLTVENNEEDEDRIASWSRTAPFWTDIKNHRAEHWRHDRRRFPEQMPPGDDPVADAVQAKRTSLPIHAYKQKLIDHVLANTVTIINGATGCGKSTQIPQYLVEAGFADSGRIAITEPRRVAASSLAARVAHEANVVLGEEVGYKIRFEAVTSDRTIVQFMTDGILLRECVNNPELKGYSVIVVDEAHERSVNIDIVLGLLKQIIKRRPSLKVIIMSATIDATKFSKYFNNAKVFHLAGQQFPVAINYLEENLCFSDHHKPVEAQLIHIVRKTVEHILESRPSGDILIFLYGERIIQKVCDELATFCKKAVILPLYRALPDEEQLRVFDPAPPGKYKIIVSTNVAESSITIDGVRYVIDSGFVKVTKYYCSNEIENLCTEPISQDQAVQRAGRVGRTQDGTCFRLYTEDYFKNSMRKRNLPELLRTDLAGILLQIKAIGVHDLLTFDFIDPPRVQDMVEAHLKLLNLAAIGYNGDLNRLGQKIASLPLSPPLSKLILHGAYIHKCSEEMAAIASMISSMPVFARHSSTKNCNAPIEVELGEEDEMSVRDVLRKLLNDVDNMEIPESPKSPSAYKFFRPEGDLVALVHAWRGYLDNDCSEEWCKAQGLLSRSMMQAKQIQKQLLGILQKEEIPINSCKDDTSAIQRTVAAVLRRNVAVKTLDRNRDVVYHPLGKTDAYPLAMDSVLNASEADYIIYLKLDSRGRTFLSYNTAVESSFLDIDLPAIESENPDRDYAEFAVHRRWEEQQLMDRVNAAYKPSIYGAAPIQDNRAVYQDPLEEYNY